MTSVGGGGCIQKVSDNLQPFGHSQVVEVSFSGRVHELRDSQKCFASEGRSRGMGKARVFSELCGRLLIVVSAKDYSTIW